MIQLDIAEFDKIWDDYVDEVEAKAKTNFSRQKWIMFGYYKAVVIHLRKLKRKIRNDLISKSVGFPTRHEREALQRCSISTGAREPGPSVLQKT